MNLSCGFKLPLIEPQLQLRWLHWNTSWISNGFLLLRKNYMATSFIILSRWQNIINESFNWPHQQPARQFLRGRSKVQKGLINKKVSLGILWYVGETKTQLNTQAFSTRRIGPWGISIQLNWITWEPALSFWLGHSNSQLYSHFLPLLLVLPACSCSC